ncbi:MAG: 3-hydroxyacyl-CoA dehydrogenase [Cytophagales bacterium]|nr:3-hydroxyacyl-CoA dehydrogenase [Cytophagales bacterium]
MRKIEKIAVLGSGVMGSRIACHFANIGVNVLLLDIVPRELNAKEEAKGLSLEHPAVRNRIVNDALSFAVKSNPSPIYHKKFLDRVTTGNFDDDLAKISDVDWIIEVVVENLDIKKKVFTNVEKYRKEGTLISSNTSGIPMELMLEGRSEDFQKHFCGTHFFNPPRYLKLLEVIPSTKTSPEVTDFFMKYGEQFLGKTTVLCKDTPAFIANRVGIYSIMQTLQVVNELGLSVDEVDKLTGPVIGRPKSATFRTMDVVGNDTLIKVANNLYAGLVNDEVRETFKLPEMLQKIEENKWFGAKSGQGFYKKVKNEKGKSEILSLNLSSFEYEPKQKVKFATLEQTKPIEELKPRFKVLLGGKDKAGEFYRQTFFGLFQYVTNRIPEITDELYKIDDAIKAGFGWELGPFETWDTLGVAKGVEMMESMGLTPANWVKEMLESGAESFYKVEGGTRQYYDIEQKAYVSIPGLENFILLDTIRENKVVWSNSGASIFDIGDGILNLEFHSKMNTMGGEVIQGINKAIDLAEKDYQGLVVANEGANFSAGANLGLVFMYAIEQEYEEIDLMIRQFQNTMMKVRYSSIPVVVAPHGMALGGGCEITLHADKVQAAAETYIGLVEFGVGLIPAGGGTKELTLRVSNNIEVDDIVFNSYKNAFLNIGMAKVSTSAHEAFDLGILQKGDAISVNKNRQIADAKRQALNLVEAGYTTPIQQKDIKVYGKQVLGMFHAGANSMLAGGYISEHDHLISQKLGYVMAGGDLSAPTTVSEQYLLDLEREAFLSLTGEKKTLERIQSILTKGKPLRN